MSRVLIGILAAVALIGTHVSAQPAKAQPAKETPKAKPAPEPTEVKSFTVQNFTPAEINATLVTVWSKLPRKAGEKAKNLPKIAVHDRTKSIIAVGTKEELEQLGMILESLDVDPAKSSSDKGVLFLIRLKHAQTQEAISALSALELSEHVLPIGNSRTLVVVPVSTTCGTQVKQVLELLDKESAKTTTKKPTN